MNGCGALTVFPCTDAYTFNCLFVLNLAIISTSIENSLPFPSFSILDITCEMCIVTLCACLRGLLSSNIVM